MYPNLQEMSDQVDIPLGDCQNTNNSEPNNRRQKSSIVNRYCTAIVPRRTGGRRRYRSELPVAHSTEYKVETDGAYEDEYTCFPPPFTMIFLSAIQIGLFLYDAMKVGDTYSLRGPIAHNLIYNPNHRAEVWRFLSYMMVHVGMFHLVVNLLVQILLGVPLEMVHRWWRVLIIYLIGVLAGSLATSITDPHVYLAGASGGVYALITAHVATIIMNWSEMEYACFQMLVFLGLAVLDVGNAVYTRYVIEKVDQIGYTAHLGGAVAGLLVGIYLLRNLEVKSHERYLWWFALFLSFILFGVGIFWNLADPEHWSKRRY